MAVHGVGENWLTRFCDTYKQDRPFQFAIPSWHTPPSLGGLSKGGEKKWTCGTLSTASARDSVLCESLGLEGKALADLIQRGALLNQRSAHLDGLGGQKPESASL